MTGSFNFPKPEFDVEATVERAMALINRTLQPSLEEAQKAVDKVRASKPLVAPVDLVSQVTRGNRIRAARAVSFSLPSILPGVGTAISAAALPVALREVLKESVSAAVKVGLLHDRDLTDPELTRIAVLLVLTEGAVKLDKTGRIHPDAILGRHASLVGKPASFDALAALTEKERQEISASESEILRAWALAVGPPLLAGLLPFGVGPMAAANYMQYVLRGTIAAAARVFGPAAPTPATVEEVPEREIQQEDSDS
ncbi:hypothetical protein E4P39_03415 [Blastococcus sp. CT_GayMR19]|uniref:hypothetical protein n=1 Tax=Blastococcus sp. CT_GayMR19 TaxID=2559608 RepID=UPI001073D675|nr:hypothetical protein [Blastococcus sp. CT_GayMR19]TFV78287.1 hypothetical protein E4P39_03415 [Blastococcus sp. CT_GayMR19]